MTTRLRSGLAALTVVFGLGLASRAGAQSPPPPAPATAPATPAPVPASTPAPAMGTTAAAPAPWAPGKVELEAGLFMAVPRGDLKNSANTSGGIRLAGGYAIFPWLNVHAAYRNVQVSSKSSFDVTYYDFALGVRLTLYQPTIKPFVDFEGGDAKVAVLGFSKSGVGGAGRVGAEYFFPHTRWGVAGAFSFSHATIDSQTSEWMGIEAHAQCRF